MSTHIVSSEVSRTHCLQSSYKIGATCLGVSNVSFIPFQIALEGLSLRKGTNQLLSNARLPISFSQYHYGLNTIHAIPKHRPKFPSSPF